MQERQLDVQHLWRSHERARWPEDLADTWPFGLRLKLHFGTFAKAGVIKLLFACLLMTETLSGLIA